VGDRRREVAGSRRSPSGVAGDLTGDVDLAGAGADRDVVVGGRLHGTCGAERLHGHGRLQGPGRFDSRSTDLRRAIPSVTGKSLTATLRDPVDALLRWTSVHLPQVEAARDRFEA
jgi:hypothetical protein